MTLLHEVASVAQDVIQLVISLLQTFWDNETRGIEQAGNEYLLRTGAVHDIITKARAGGLSTDNLTSVRKIWQQNHDAIDDGLKEISEMINATNEQVEDDLEDDGWDELGFQSSRKMDQTELERAKKVVSSVTSLHGCLIVFISIDTRRFAFINSLTQTNPKRHFISSTRLAVAFPAPCYSRLGYLAITLICTSYQH